MAVKISVRSTKQALKVAEKAGGKGTSGSAGQPKKPVGTGPAAGVTWDLADLYPGILAPELKTDQEQAVARAQAFAKRYRGKINVKGGPAPATLAKALAEYEALLETVYRLSAFASLTHAADSLAEANGRLLNQIQLVGTSVSTQIMFFDLEWIALDDRSAKKVADDKAVARWRHYLNSIRRYKPHTLSEPEEIVLAEKGVTGNQAFTRLFDEIESRATYSLPGENGEAKLVNQSEALAKLYDADREVRKAAHAAFTAGLKRDTHLTGYILNTLLQDHATNMRLRKYDNPMAARHLSNEISAQAVDALLASCEKNADVVQGYYKLKSQLLGLAPLYDYDRYAPVKIAGVELPSVSWEECTRLVKEAYSAFSPELGEIVQEFIDKKWVDAELRPGKRGGAFCASTVPSVHPYTLMNYTGKLRDVMTFAHELGHGVHQYLSRPNGILLADTPLTVAETASVFGEMLTFERLQQEYTDPKVRLALLCSKLEDSFATVFRQACMTRFEQKIHALRTEGELTIEQFDQAWLDANKKMFGKSVQLTDEYKRWWSYIGHFVHSPFYCYAYSFGELLVLALYAKYKQQGQAFVPGYLQLLRSGGSDTPANLVAKLGLDVTDPTFWDGGLAILRNLVADAKKLAKKA